MCSLNIALEEINQAREAGQKEFRFYVGRYSGFAITVLKDLRDLGFSVIRCRGIEYKIDL